MYYNMLTGGWEYMHIYVNIHIIINDINTLRAKELSIIVNIHFHKCTKHTLRQMCMVNVHL